LSSKVLVEGKGRGEEERREERGGGRGRMMRMTQESSD